MKRKMLTQDVSLLRSGLPGRGHGGWCARTTGEPRVLCALRAPVRWGPARSAPLSEEVRLAVRRALARARERRAAMDHASELCVFSARLLCRSAFASW